MNFPDTFTMLAQISDEIPTVFPFPFQMHLILSVISVFFFGYRFATNKRPYQLIFAIAVPLSMTIWISNNKTFFYILGLIEFVLIAAAFILSIAIKPQEESGKTAASGKSDDKHIEENAEDEED